MFKILQISTLLALAVAAPSHVDTLPQHIGTAIVAEPTHVQLHEPTLAKVGDVVESVPTAVSHQSSTIVHSRAQRVTPIVTPAVRSYAAPAVRTYAAPVIGQAPVMRTFATAAHLSPAAAFIHAHAPFQLRTLAAGPSFAAYTYGAPFIYPTSILH